MESANLHDQHHHQLQDQLAVGISSLSPPPSFYAVGTSNHVWSPNITTNSLVNGGHRYGTSLYEGVQLPEDTRNSTHDNENRALPFNSSIIQDMGTFNWRSSTEAAENSHLTSHANINDSSQHLSRVKEEILADQNHTFPKFTAMLNCNTSLHINEDNHYGRDFDQKKDMNSNSLSEKLLLKSTLSSGHFFAHNNNFPIPMHSFGGNNIGMPLISRGNFSQIYPSINISNLNHSSSSSSLDMNMQALDLLTSSTLSGSNFNHDGVIGKSFTFGSVDHIHRQNDSPSCSPNNISHFTNGVAEAKRPSSSALVEPKVPPSKSQTAPKKSRLEPRASCPPFKVRKEKLGDRIAALQQLVAPYGKTDTASVLLEAIGYIKFLQNQVETLSVPYMKSSRNQSNNRSVTQGSQCRIRGNNGKEETKRDLRSRGLCLVPLSCMSYVTGDAGTGGMWPS